MTIDEAIATFRTETASMPAAAVIYSRLDDFAAQVVSSGGELSRERALEIVRECRQLIVESANPDDLTSQRDAARVADFAGWKLSKILSKVNGGIAPLHEGPVPWRPKARTSKEDS
jgi:hypothetical protein